MRSITSRRNLSIVPAIAPGRAGSASDPPLKNPRSPHRRSVATVLAAATVTAVVVACFGAQTAVAQTASAQTASAQTALARETSGAAGAKGGAISPHAVTVSLKWERLLGANTQIVESSPNQARLDSDGLSIVVGSRGNGCVYAVHLSNGSTTPGWPKCTDAGIDSSPAVYPTGGGLDDVYVTTGDTSGEQPPAFNENCGSDLPECVGSVYAFGPSGNQLWARNLPDVFGTDGSHPPIFASPTIGDPGSGRPELVVGGLSQSLYALNLSNGATEPGWPQQTADTTFASAAIANIDGAQHIVVGSDSTGGAGAFNDWNGGSVKSMNANGSTNWTAASNEVVTSSPVVGNLNGSGPVVVYGHGRYWNGSDDDGLTVDNAATGGLEWERYLGGYTRATPALADLLGNKQLDVIEPTWSALGQTTGGTLWAFGPGGNRLWGPVSFVMNPTITGGVATADLGGGYQDVIVATGLGWYVVDGRTGAVYPPNGLNVTWPGQTAANLSMSNSPLVVPDPSGDGVDVVVAGTYYGIRGDNTQGFIAVYHVTGGPNSTGEGSWPQFHHDPQLTGSTIAPAAPDNNACHPNVPPCSIEGYTLGATDGGVFAFGDSAYHGSMGNRRLNRPIVGMAAGPDNAGYWLVASDGGMFSFGSAKYHGSMGGRFLARPIVGMARTPDGNGYWLVASDGGIFSFGDAKYYGSMGNRHLNKPIVGMTSTKDGKGYWLVASDGGIFAFGDAKFHGSMGNRHLNKPIVGMATEPNGAGYWMVASDGGIFAFDAGFHGSTGAMRLNRPVVGMAATSSGDGYWLVASDGGVFSFGDAFFRGSTGDITLNAPIVAMAATG
jgi:ribosomal protein L24E